MIPHFVRYSTQFGPPSAVAVYMWDDINITGTNRMKRSTYLILDYFVVEQSLTSVGQIKLISNEAEILVSLGSLDICVGVTECDSSQSSEKVALSPLALLTKLLLRTSQTRPLVLTPDQL